MFKDYYKILGIEFGASSEQIKKAFKKQAIKWHPDKNPGRDTTLKMQDINEAYIIFKDPEARLRYDEEYSRYQNFERRKSQKTEPEQQQARTQDKQAKAERTEYYQEKRREQQSDFEVRDEILSKWMTNAQKQAVDLAKKSLSDLIGMTSAGLMAGIKASGQFLMFQLGCLVVIIVIIFLITIIKMI